MPLVYVGLGSNLGDRAAFLSSARRKLEEAGLKPVAQSSVSETRPVNVTDQPDFLNQVVAIRTDKGPFELLDLLKSIEAALGRTPSVRRGPRVIDLDILLYGKKILCTERLVIPHPEIRNRRFIIEQLAELDENLVDPLTGKCYARMLVYKGPPADTQE